MAPMRMNQACVPTDSRSFLSAQQCLYFLPLPQGHGSLRPGWLLTTTPLLRPYSNQREWIHAGVEEAHSPVQMRPRHAPRRAGQAELLTALDEIASGHVD